MRICEKKSRTFPLLIFDLIPVFINPLFISSFCQLDQNELALTLKALRDGEDSIVTGTGHRVATPVGFVHAIERHMFSVENSVGFQIRDPQLPGVVEDAASFDADGARSCARETQFHSRQLHGTHRDKTSLVIKIPGRIHRNKDDVLMTHPYKLAWTTSFLCFGTLFQPRRPERSGHCSRTLPCPCSRVASSQQR